MNPTKPILLLALSLSLLLSCRKELPKGPVELQTLAATNITYNSVTLGGKIIDAKGTEITERGICLDTVSNPDIVKKHVIDASTMEFSKEFTGLTMGITYYAKAYVINNVGTFYGDEVCFTTTILLAPVLTTHAASNITHNAAVSGGNITHDGGSPITARGVCWRTSPNPTTANNKTSNGTGTGNFTSNITSLVPGTTYYVRAYATNANETSYGNQITFNTGSTLPTLTTNTVSSITHNAAVCGGNISSDGGSPVTARGVCWGTSQNPTTANSTTDDGTGTGSFTSNITGLLPNTTYYVRAYAINVEGTAYGIQRIFTTVWACGLNITFTYAGSTVTYGTVTSVGGKCWMDRNLGATAVATSSTHTASYGHLFQWGRGVDGHQIRTSGTTSTLSSSNLPGHGNFILTNSSPHDWRNPQNPNLWQGVNGINNPCPSGWRLPTETEWNIERLSWSNNNAIGAFASPLKLPMAGSRFHSTGSLGSVGTMGIYWASTVNNLISHRLLFSSNEANVSANTRANGFSVRCVKN